jgi:hypothetical protein
VPTFKELKSVALLFAAVLSVLAVLSAVVEPAELLELLDPVQAVADSANAPAKRTLHNFLTLFISLPPKFKLTFV